MPRSEKQKQKLFRLLEILIKYTDDTTGVSMKEILEKHHANYGVESVLGEGSTFWFELPVAQYNEQNHKEN